MFIGSGGLQAVSGTGTLTGARSPSRPRAGAMVTAGRDAEGNRRRSGSDLAGPGTSPHPTPDRHTHIVTVIGLRDGIPDVITPNFLPPTMFPTGSVPCSVLFRPPGPAL